MFKIFLNRFVQFIFIIILISISSVDKAHAIGARMLFAAGIDYITYEELHSTQPTLNKDFTEMLTKYEFDTRFYIFSNTFYLGVAADYKGPVINSSTTDKVSYLNYRGIGGMTIWSKPVNIILEGEYYFDTMTPNSSTFGYEDISGLKFTGTIFHTTRDGRFHFEAKYPFWLPITGLTEYSGSMSVNFGQTESKETAQLIKGWILKLDYKYFNLEQTGLSNLSISSHTFGLSLGFNW